MTIIVKNKETLLFDDFKIKCSIGKKGSNIKKKEGDYTSPKGTFDLGIIYYRADKLQKPDSKIKCVKIKKNMGWCDDPLDLKNYNKLIKLNKKIKCEKLYRKDHNYDLLLPIKYNFLKPVKFKGSCIFIHLTNNYKPTLGCIALKKKDFLIILRLINNKTKIKII